MAQWIATLNAAPDLDELCKILPGMPVSYQMKPYFAILLPEVLARFAKPHHERLMELLRLDLEPACGTSGRDTTAPGPSFVEVRRLHAFFSKQDAKAAADFRALAVKRGWAGGDYSGQIAQELLKDGQRAAAIEWLANMVIQRRFPPCWSEPYRFPIRQNIPADYLLDEYLPVAALELITSEKLALPIEAAIAAMPGVHDPVLSGFLKFYDSPSMESFERHLGGLTSPTNPHLARTLRARLPYFLSRIEATKALAEDLKEAAGKKN